MWERVFGIMQEEMQSFMTDEFKDFMNSVGMNANEIRGMAERQMAFDSYRVLGLEKTASDVEVKNRFRELVKKLHPDSAGIPGTRYLFELVLAAYEAIKHERGIT